jgi:hypothetical protein
MQIEGFVLKFSPAEGLEKVKKACEIGLNSACEAYGNLHIRGIPSRDGIPGVDRNPNLALPFLKKACKNRIPLACHK